MLKFIILLAVVAVCCGQLQGVTYTLYNLQGITSMPSSGDLPHLYMGGNTILLIHGYPGNGATKFNELVRDAILDTHEGCDIIVVDWRRIAGSNYTQASARVHDVAIDLTRFLQWLIFSSVLPYEGHFHLVGFDLGAHIAGLAGRYLQTGEVRIQVGRITGLNPSGHLWGAGSQRLRQGDARYVEVIYTDTLGVLANSDGDAIGDVNFYANGGSNQPGCLTHSCNHERAFELFAASMINPNLFGHKCSSMTQMNLNLCRGVPLLKLGGTELSKHGASGIYRIDTSRRYPFY